MAERKFSTISESFFAQARLISGASASSSSVSKSVGKEQRPLGSLKWAISSKS